MSNQTRKSKFGLGLILGSIIGGVTAFFLSPKTGKENRKAAAKKINELKKFLEEEKVDEKLKEVYLTAKDWLIEEIDQLRDTVENFDYEKYQKAVNKVMTRVKKETKKGGKEMEKLKDQLLKEWNKLKD